MYNHVKKSSRRLTKIMARQARETQVGRQMAVIVMSNFACWFPIITMGLIALSGFAIPATAYSWTAVFVLPFNSASNPIIYTLAQLRPSLFQAQKRESLTVLRPMLWPQNSKDTANRTIRPLRSPFGYMSLLEFLRRSEPLTARDLLEVTYSISEQISQIHSSGYALGSIKADNIFISESLDCRIRAYLPDHLAYRVKNSMDSDDYAVDIEDFGLLVKYMLRVYHSKNQQQQQLNNR